MFIAQHQYTSFPCHRSFLLSHGIQTYLSTFILTRQVTIQPQVPTQTLPILEVAGAKVVLPPEDEFLFLGRGGPSVSFFATHGGEHWCWCWPRWLVEGIGRGIRLVEGKGANVGQRSGTMARETEAGWSLLVRHSLRVEWCGGGKRAGLAGRTLLSWRVGWYGSRKMVGLARLGRLAGLAGLNRLASLARLDGLGRLARLDGLVAGLAGFVGFVHPRRVKVLGPQKSVPGTTVLITVQGGTRGEALSFMISEEREDGQTRCS